MPFTPIHMGPGAAIKVVGGRHFSLLLFGFTQVVMDIEPLVRMIRGDLVIHGVSHTYLGATVVALLSLVLGRPMCQWLLRWWNQGSREGLLASLQAPNVIPWFAAAAGAFIGAYSHVVLDSVMHADMRPWQPFLEENRMLGVVSIEALHLLCIVLGAVGLAALAVLAIWKKLSHKNKRKA